MWSVIRENKAFVRREEKKKGGKTTKRGKVVCAASVSDSSGRGEVRGNWLSYNKEWGYGGMSAEVRDSPMSNVTNK